jgi:hypothetical protein
MDIKENVCQFCLKTFKSPRGVKTHYPACKEKTKQAPTAACMAALTTMGLSATMDASIGVESASTNGTSIERPEFQKDDVEQAYESIVYWRKNLFQLPSGKIGKIVVSEMTRIVNLWNDDTMWSGHAWKMMMILPNLLLQRTTNVKNTKYTNKVNKEHLERRFDLWRKGKVKELLNEGQALQNRLPSFTANASDGSELARRFRNLMTSGNVNGAIRLLNESTKGLLQMNNDTIRQLDEKHPDAEHMHEDLLIRGDKPEVNPIIFDSIDAELIKKMALKTNGAAGPSNLDADNWKHILGSKSFSCEGNDLCKALARTARILSTRLIDSSATSALMACSLIPLDKDPGVRPIGIGEVIRRILAKAVTHVLREDMKSAAGGLQLCVGQEGGCEAAIHAMVEIFNDDKCDGLIQVDANNAFNTINRSVLLHNIFYLCPEISIFTANCYAIPLHLFVVGGGEIASKEGTTQGDPIAMPIYAIGIRPLLLVLTERITRIDETQQQTRDEQVKVCAFADDLAGTGELDSLRLWWDKVVTLGPSIGYTAKPSKSWLIVKEESYEKAVKIFASSGLNITSEGKKHLGAVIGTAEFKASYIREKVSTWVGELKKLTEIAKTEPHSAFSCFIHGLKHRYTYTMRTVPNIAEFLLPLDAAIDELVSVLFHGQAISTTLRSLISLPAKMGGLGIAIPSKLSDTQYQTSMDVTKQLKDHVKMQCWELNIDEVKVREAKSRARAQKEQSNKHILNEIKNKLSAEKLRLLGVTSEKGASAWINTLPIKQQGFLFDKQTFHDAIQLRYGFDLPRLPTHCVCGCVFNVVHALTCNIGGFITIRHNDIRDKTAKLLSEVCNDVSVEPVLQPLSGENLRYKTSAREEDARVDVSARGFWTRGSRAFLDVRVFNPIARSYKSKSLESAYRQNENEKKRRYSERVREVEHGSFTPLVFTAFGGMGRECDRFYKQLADKLSEKQDVPRSVATNYVRTAINFSLIKSIALCMRGSRRARAHPMRTETPVEILLESNRANISNLD